MPAKGRKNPRRPQARTTKKEMRRPTIADLYCKGWTQVEIAQELGISPGRVCQELGEMKAIWKAEFLDAVEKTRAAEVRRVLYLERTYWDQFEKSCIRKVYPKDKDGEIGYDCDPGEIREVEVLGDPDLLAGIKACIELRCKIEGLFKEGAQINQVQVFTVERLAQEVQKAQAKHRMEVEAQNNRLRLEIGADGVAAMQHGGGGADVTHDKVMADYAVEERIAMPEVTGTGGIDDDGIQLY